ncbi:hypothetical protein [Mycolicibacterium aubagnense]|uniref:Uncharacterized protein n=1 Tax=Mycolicibacterium aubagnense TaxID=319707 RepID=A0ABN5YKI1_9MYCO|nr:hypothetical protein [Mycolicibacterium aubagnense]TLH64429.1 hypothetical protein C1S80_12140 [Mycolicibacterium aubagnense]BBX82160.1 hypothetical protein MAUB_00330 [Mycolicibacterium aubagnense]
MRRNGKQEASATAAVRERGVHPAARAQYVRYRGYTPLHPVTSPVNAPPRELDDLRHAYSGVGPHTAGDGLDGGLPLSPADIVEIEADRAARRQDLIDLFVAETRLCREDVATDEQWRLWADEEIASIVAATSTTESEQAQGERLHRASAITYRDAEGEVETISRAEATRIAKAYARLSGRSEAGSVEFFVSLANTDAVLAHGVHFGRCDTPLEAIGERSWQAYLKRERGDEQRARRGVADDVARVFAGQNEAKYATRAAAEQCEDIDQAAHLVVERWSQNPSDVWKQLPPGLPNRTPLILGDLISERHTLAAEPFGYADFFDTHPASGGIYAAEYSVVEELAAAIKQLHGGRDPLIAMVADEIAERAAAARAMPTTTLAERVERQWLLVELTDAAQKLVGSPDAIKNVTVLPVVHPDQLRLFEPAGAPA